MIKLLTATIVTVAIASSSSACWFPFFPTYSAGYAGWGFPAPAYSYASYAPSYGYQNNCNYAPSASYGVPYSASYGGFSTSMGCNTCGQSSCCGTCNNISTVGFANYGAGCANNCLSTNCIPSDIVNKPVADPIGGASDRNRPADDNRNSRPADDNTRERPSTYEPPRANDPPEPLWPSGRDSGSRDSDRSGDFGPRRSREGTDSGGLIDNPDRAWERSGAGEGTDNTEGNPLFREDRVRKPPMGEPEDADATGDLIDQTGYKPPISDPIMQEEGGAVESEDPDLIAPEEPAESARRSSIFYASNTRFRSSHSDVLRPQRTAGNVSKRSPFTQISTSRNSQRAPRWISVPMPLGRERI